MEPSRTHRFLGLSQQEIKQKLDAILNFADIGKFVERPLRTYSSGMALRLAFAVQVCIDPDVLVIDEALAVGDELFQKKCFNRLNELKEQGTRNKEQGTRNKEHPSYL